MSSEQRIKQVRRQIRLLKRMQATPKLPPAMREKIGRTIQLGRKAIVAHQIAPTK